MNDGILDATLVCGCETLVFLGSEVKIGVVEMDDLLIKVGIRTDRVKNEDVSKIYGMKK